MAEAQNQENGTADQPLNEDNVPQQVEQTGEAIIKGAQDDDQLDRLKEGNTTDTPEKSKDTNLKKINVADPDDLREIRTSDDIDEPDPEGEYPPTNAEVPTEDINPEP